jgi:hypothetical protein
MRSLALLTALTLAPALYGGVDFVQHADSIEVTLDGKPLTTLYFGDETTKPYLHPLRAADGTIVTRRYPMSDDVPGEAHDHPHHRGLWYTHGDVNGFDFWANEKDQKPQEKKGRVVLKGVHKAGDGFIRADFEWRSPIGEVLLTENRIIRFQKAGQIVLVDFDITLKAEIKTVKFGDTKEGTFAIRLNEQMREMKHDKTPGDGVIVNAEGAVGEKNTWGKQSPWVDYSGPIDGKTYGVAIFDHPKNPKYPTYWHVRAYGLFAANPFGEHDFHRDDSRDGSITLEPGKSMRFQYRVAIHPGDAKAAGVEKLFKRWSGR